MTILKEFLILLEDRIDYAIKQFSEKVGKTLTADTSSNKPKSPEAAIRELNKISPQNIVWLCRMYSAKQFKFEDDSRVKDTIETFDKVKKELEVKDLNSYKTMKSLYDAIEPFEGAETEAASKKQAAKQIKTSETDVFMKEPDLLVLIPKTEASACKYGAGTKWCTAAEKNNKFNDYNDDGKLYIVIAPTLPKKKIGNSEYERKFQFHYQTDSFMDEQDEPVEETDLVALSKLPGYKKFLNKLIKLHYGPHIEDLMPEENNAPGGADLYSLHSDPKSLDHHDKAHDSVPRLISKKYKLFTGHPNLYELKKHLKQLCRDPEIGFYAACRLEIRVPMIEDWIAKNAQKSHMYAVEVLDGPFHAGEVAIAKDFQVLKNYLKDVLNGKRLSPEAERAIHGASCTRVYKDYLEEHNLE